MLHSDHVKNSVFTESFFRAHQFVNQLSLKAKQSGFDPKGIKILHKNHIIANDLGSADAKVTWEEGPEDWALLITICDFGNVCHYIEDGKTISFFDID